MSWPLPPRPIGISSLFRRISPYQAPFSLERSVLSTPRSSFQSLPIRAIHQNGGKPTITSKTPKLSGAKVKEPASLSARKHLGSQSKRPADSPKTNFRSISKQLNGTPSALDILSEIQYYCELKEAAAIPRSLDAFLALPSPTSTTNATNRGQTQAAKLLLTRWTELLMTHSTTLMQSLDARRILCLNEKILSMQTVEWSLRRKLAVALWYSWRSIHPSRDFQSQLTTQDGSALTAILLALHEWRQIQQKATSTTENASSTKEWIDQEILLLYKDGLVENLDPVLMAVASSHVAMQDGEKALVILQSMRSTVEPEVAISLLSFLIEQGQEDLAFSICSDWILRKKALLGSHELEHLSILAIKHVRFQFAKQLMDFMRAEKIRISPITVTRYLNACINHQKVSPLMPRKFSSW